MCEDIGKEIQQHDEDLVKLRERLRDSVKEITGSFHVDDLEHKRLLMQETAAGYENMLKARRQELQDLRNQAEAAKKRDDVYARIETSLLRM
jgi:predicted  nucleic acid-binding Zn-ribbon protein